VPTPLRETAAWLVTLDPAHTKWLAQADPESLVAHSPIVHSHEVRALIVKALLGRADEVELGDVPWARTRRDLSHPGLGAQLLAALGDTKDGQPEDWTSLARVRLAVRLAREAGTPDLASALLDLAANDAWSPHIRQLAALTAFETAPDQAVPRLIDLLDRLADVDYATRLDPDDELRGSLLNILWPAHVSTERILPHLRRRRRRNLFGTYRVFQETFASKLPEEDASAVMDWATAQLEDDGESSDFRSVTDDIPEADDDLPFDRSIGRLDPELLEGIAERGLTGDGALNRVQHVAKLVRPRLERFDRPPLPTPIDVADEHGNEPPSVLNLRRALAQSLVELSIADGTFNRAFIWEIVDGWGRDVRDQDEFITEGIHRGNRKRLLAGADFVWAYEAASDASSAGNDALAEAFAQLAAYLLEDSDAASHDLVYANQDHPIWPYVKGRFDPTPLDREQSSLLSEARGPHDAAEEQPPWTEQESFVTKLNQRLADAAEGDPDAFWRLAWDLQAQPATGMLRQRLDDDILDFPGIAVLPPDHLLMLLTAATRFLSNAHDHASEWLGTSRYDRRGWAGYLALALLERQGRLSEMADTAWPSWLGALVWFHSVSVNSGDRELKHRLLSHAAEHAAPQLADAAATYVRGELTQGQLAAEVELIDPGWQIDLTNTWIALLDTIAQAIAQSPQPRRADNDAPHATELGAPNDALNGEGGGDDVMVLSTDESRAHALRLWEVLLNALLNTPDERATQIAREALSLGSTSEHYRPVAVKAARTLLFASGPDDLSELLTIISADPLLSHDVAVECATHDRAGDFLASLAEDQLAEVYEWLSDLFPPQSDVNPEGVHFISPEEGTRDWRDRVLWRIGERGTERAVRALAKLRDEYPDRLIVMSNLLLARRNLAAAAWFPPSPNDLTALFEDFRRRLVGSENELAQLLTDVLSRIGDDLPSHGELLWDRLPRRVLSQELGLNEAWLPKMEPVLSAYISHELINRLDRRGLAVNREVLVRPTDASGAGDRTDIQVEATMRHDSVDRPTPDRLAVVIEVKGPWNSELKTAQRSQLAARYLPESKTNTGIYLVGWYPLDQWTDTGDYRRARARILNRDQLAVELEDQARDIFAEQSKKITIVLLEIPRPHRVTAVDDDDPNLPSEN
jgi:hypothetical protein